jgi:hypothetical protein
MERNAKAPLSPHEETVLHRLASGDEVRWSLVPERHVQRLRQFELVSQQGERLVLTTVGKARVAAMLSRRD